MSTKQWDGWDILIKLNTAMVIIQVPLLLFSVRYGVAGVAWAMVLAMLLEATTPGRPAGS